METVLFCEFCAICSEVEVAEVGDVVLLVGVTRRFKELRGVGIFVP